jgi:hypothetical protein
MGKRIRTIGLLIVALLSVTIGLATPSAFAGTTTTTLSPATVAAGRAYAVHLLSQQPLPSGATPVRHFATPLAIQSQEAFLVGGQIVSRGYLIPASVDIDAFVRGHLRKGEAWAGNGTGNGPGESTVYSISVSLPCTSRHVTYCGLQYETTTTPNGRQELRIALQIDWLPVVTVKMPTTGVVTVTGYGETTACCGSSKPASVVLTRQQAEKLSKAVATLKESGEGMCMEDATVLKISITDPTTGAVTWRAVGDACPGVLSISSKSTNVALDDRSCALWQVVATFFPAGEADATRGEAKTCDA